MAAGGVQECIRRVESRMNEWRNVSINIAVIGSSGVGKSSLVNAIRGLTAEDEGAAPVGFVQTTMVCRSYPHPNNPKLILWDLPGAGTQSCPRETYLSAINVDRYDFFLLITGDRFTQDDMWLGNEFRNRNKKYYFVRTKIDLDVYNDQRSYPSTHNEEAVIESIRRSTKDHLRANGFPDVPVFLIDNYEPGRFDLENLKHRVIIDAPEWIRSALVLSLQPTSEAMIRLKVNELRSRIWKYALLSGLEGAIPIPSLAVTIVVEKEVEFYMKQLHIDNDSLQRYADLYSVNINGMQAIVHRELESNRSGAVMMGGMKATLLALAVGIPPSSNVLKVLKILLSVMGVVIAWPAAYKRTYTTLTSVLDKCEQIALAIIGYIAVSVATAHAVGTDQSSNDAQSTGTFGVEELRISSSSSSSSP